jgi:uncharacterized membrane protein YqjE
MEAPATNLGHIAGKSKRFFNRFATIVENRLELFMLEVQEERERIVHVILLALGTAVFGLLAGIGLTITIVLVFWDHSPIIAGLVLTVLYAIGGLLLYTSLKRRMHDWQTLPSTLEQLKKDRECLERNLT